MVASKSFTGRRCQRGKTHIVPSHITIMREASSNYVLTDEA